MLRVETGIMTAHEIAQKLAALNTDEVFDQIFKALIAPMLDNQTIPAGGMELIRQRLLAKHTQTLRDGYAEQYERLFTAEELASILEWAESPLGQENFVAGQQVAMSIIEELETEGLSEDLFDGAIELDQSEFDSDTSLGAELLDEIYPEKSA